MPMILLDYSKRFASVANLTSLVLIERVIAMTKTTKTLVNGVELTERQNDIIAMISARYAETGTGVGFDDICQHFGFASKNALKIHIDKILASKAVLCESWNEETGRWEFSDSRNDARLRSNSLRPANMAGIAIAAKPAKSETCRSGSGYCVAIVDNSVLFTLFNGSEILENGILPIGDVMGYCDNFKIPAELAPIERIETLAQKRTAKLATLRAVKPAEVAEPAPVKKTRAKRK
jgi:hypothetical protein